MIRLLNRRASSFYPATNLRAFSTGTCLTQDIQGSKRASPTSSDARDDTGDASDGPAGPLQKLKKQTNTEADLMAKMKAAMGDRDEGGAAGIEYEDGKAVSMKRGVKNNMFRYI